MKTLLLSTSILAAAAFPAANLAYAGATAPTLVGSEASTPKAEVIRVVRVTTSATKDTDCASATWPNIPPSCLQRESDPKPTNVSLND